MTVFRYGLRSMTERDKRTKLKIALSCTALGIAYNSTSTVVSLILC